MEILAPRSGFYLYLERSLHHYKNYIKLPIFKVDTFANHLFCGNPAAVLPLGQWLSDEVMQNIALENNQPITVFYVSTGNGFHVRWFTPTSESNICEHGTLAAAFVISKFQNYAQNKICFESRSGDLTVNVNDDWLTLNCAVDQYKTALPSPALLESLAANTIVEVSSKAAQITWLCSAPNMN